MKILTVITGMKSGGAERVMATLCNEFSRKNEVELAILKSSESDYFLEKKVKIVSGNVKNKSLFSSVKFLKREMETYKPDIILSFMSSSNILSLIARKFSKHKCPIVIAQRANPYYGVSLKFKILKRLTYGGANGCVLQTKEAMDFYKSRVRCECIVIRNPLSRDFNIKPYKGKRDKKIVCTARLSKEKNQKLLIESFNLIKDKYPDYRVEIYGEGPERDNLQNLIDELNLNSRVKLMGRKSNIIDCIKDSAIFVLPSNSEGMPNALLEALALGIPSIATDCPIGGSKVIVKNNINGMLIPMNDEKKLADSMEKIISDEKFANMISKNAVKVIDEFNTEEVCKEWEDFLIKVKNGVKK